MNTFEFAENLGYTPALDIPKPSFPKFPTPFEFTSLNVSQIGNKYYGNNAVVDTKGFKVYLDEESKKIINDNNPDIPSTDLKEIILYSNQSFKEFEDFDLVLFTSTNGVTLLQQYKTVEVASDQIAIFLEIDNKTNIFGSVMRIKVGSNVLGKKELPYAEIIKHAHNKSITISSKKLKKLLKGGVYKKKESFFRWALSSIGEVLSDTVQFITGGIGDLFFKHFPKALNKIKIEKKYWNPTADGFDALFIPDSFETYVEKQKGKTNVEHKIINAFIKPFFKKIDTLEDNVKGKLKAIKHVLPNKVYKRIKKTLDYVFNQFETLEGLFLNSEYGFLNLILTSLQAANAFICGLYNSLVDTISGIFQLIGLVFLGVKEIADFAENTGYYASLTVEFIENSIEGILKINFLELFKELFFVPLKLVQKVVQFVSTQAKLSIQEVHYYLGYIVGFIVETTISILFSGGILTVDKVLLKTFKEPVDLLLKGFKGAVNAAKSLLSKLMVAFKKILKALSNPKQLINDFLKFLDELFGIGKKGTKARTGNFFTELAKTKRLIDDVISEQIKHFESTHKNKDIEYGGLFADEGKELVPIIKGESMVIDFGRKNILKARQKLLKLKKPINELIITHNHPPPGSSLSFSDIFLAMKNNAKKMRAVNPDGSVFELTRIGKYPNGDSQLIDFIDDINRKLEFGYPNLKVRSIEYQLKKADLAIEKLGKNIEYTHYTN